MVSARAVGVGAIMLGTGLARAETPPVFHDQAYTYTATPLREPGAAAGDTAAVRFTVPEGASLLYLDAAYGPASGVEHALTLTIWDDTAGTLEPGAVLTTETRTVRGDDALSTFSLSTGPLPAQIRVGLTTTVAAPPSVGLDTDGLDATGRNFVRRADGDWQASETAGLAGDWMIGITTTDPGPGPEPVLPDAALAPDAAGEAPVMADDGGCCSGAPAPGGAWVLALGALLVLRRRR